MTKTKSPKLLDAEIEAELESARRVWGTSAAQRRADLDPPSPLNTCVYCGKPTRKGSITLDEGRTAHRSCYKEFETDVIK